MCAKRRKRCTPVSTLEVMVVIKAQTYSQTRSVSIIGNKAALLGQLTFIICTIGKKDIC